MDGIVSALYSFRGAMARGICRPAVLERIPNSGFSARPRQSEEERGPVAVSDEELVERIKTGDSVAPRELVRRYQGKAFSLAYGLAGGDRGEAEDLTQEAFLKVFRKLATFKGESTFHTWFHRIVVNTCLDGLRRRRRREKILSLWPLRQKEDGPSLEEAPESLDRDREHDPLQALSSREFSREVRRALTGLTGKQRLVFQLKVIQGLTIREIAEVTDLAQGTVKSHLFRATRSLRKTLAEWAEP